MQNISSNALLRLPQVLALIPVSRSAWWEVAKQPLSKTRQLGPRTTAWRAADIAALGKLTAEPEGKMNLVSSPALRPSPPHGCRAVIRSRPCPVGPLRRALTG